MRITAASVLAALAIGAVALVWANDSKTRVAPYRLRLLEAPPVEKEIAFYEERLRRSPDGALDLASLASAQLRARKLDAAEANARESLKRLPVFNVAAKVVLAQIAQARHRFDEAIRLATEILKEKPRQPDALSLLVTASLGLGRVQDAARWADELVERLPTVGSMTQRALALEAVGRTREAVAEFERGIQLEDVGEMEASSRARALLGRLHLRHGRVEEARELLVESMRIHPESALALGLLAQVEERCGEAVDAERHYTEAYRQSGDAMWLARKARVKGDAKLLAEAERLLRADGSHRRPLAEVLLERGAHEEALALMMEESKARRDWETLEVLARALLAAGRAREAQSVVREALRSGVEDEGLWRTAAAVERALGVEWRARVYERMLGA